MYDRTDRSPVPRNGHTLVTGIVARISGWANQKELSLREQVDHAEGIVAEMYDGLIEYRFIATKGGAQECCDAAPAHSRTKVS